MKKFLLLFVIVFFVGCAPYIEKLDTDGLPEEYSNAYLLYHWDDIENYASTFKIESDVVLYIFFNKCIILRKEK